MTDSFTADATLARPENRARRVLVTGAAGRIGSYVAAHAPDRYDLHLMVQDAAQGEAIAAYGEVVVADLGDLDRLKDLCQGIDTVVHLAGDPSPDATWSSLLQTNIVGTYHTFVAAKAAGCRRVVYASSIHAVSGYPADVQVKTRRSTRATSTASPSASARRWGATWPSRKGSRSSRCALAPSSRWRPSSRTTACRISMPSSRSGTCIN